MDTYRITLVHGYTLYMDIVDSFMYGTQKSFGPGKPFYSYYLLVLCRLINLIDHQLELSYDQMLDCHSS